MASSLKYFVAYWQPYLSPLTPSLKRIAIRILDEGLPSLADLSIICMASS